MTIQFTYLDLVDNTISFQPIMAANWFSSQDGQYSLFSEDERYKKQLPGYLGTRCIVEMELAKELSVIQKELATIGYGLKVYDAYRPQKTVNFFTEWSQLPDTPLAKKQHYPHTQKKDFHELSYLSRTSSHTLGTAIDVTLVPLEKHDVIGPPLGFLGVWDPESLDMGNVGYLCFDERSWMSYPHLTDIQKENRRLLSEAMLSHGFLPLDTEFWHYYFKPERNKVQFFDFDIRDDYQVFPDLSLNIFSTERMYA